MQAYFTSAVPASSLCLLSTAAPFVWTKIIFLQLNNPKQSNTPQTFDRDGYSRSSSLGLLTVFAPHLRNMPTKTPICPPLREALLRCFAAITCLSTEDIDVAAPSEAICEIFTGVDGALDLSLQPDGRIAFDDPQGFRVHADILQIGGRFVERIHATKPLHGGFVTSVSDLLLLRAVTVVERGGSDGDVLDFTWLLSEVVKTGDFPKIEEEELEYLVKAAKSCMGVLGCLVVAGLIGPNNGAAAARLLMSDV